MSLVLGIETSCDETAVGIVRERTLLANVISSSVNEHARFGGVVPEIASRAHLEAMPHVIKRALNEAKVTLNDIDAIAVTAGPGLIGALLVGTSSASALALALDKPIYGVNHLSAHIAVDALDSKGELPAAIALLVSGGHSSILQVNDLTQDVQILGSTIDDAAGEAFDKVAKLLQLGYPGGPIIEKLASEVGFQDFFNYPRNKNNDLMFSFSGLKTAVLYDAVKRGAYHLQKKELLNHSLQFKQQMASSFLVCVADIFVQKVERAISESYNNYKALAFVGGVACNKYIRSRLEETAKKNGIPFFFPSPKYCTDNAGMIAFVGHYKAQQEKFSNLNFDIL